MNNTEPTKADLLQGRLVDFTVQHKDVATNTLKIADALDVPHKNVTRVVRRLLKNEKIDRLATERIYLDKLNRKQSFFRLGEVEALRVIMNLKGDKADQLHKEIAEILGISEGTSKSNLSKAKFNLQNVLKEKFTNID